MKPPHSPSSDQDDHEDLIGFALGLIDLPEDAETSDDAKPSIRLFDAAPAFQTPSDSSLAQINRIRQGLDLLLDDGQDDDLEPPAALFEQSLNRVKQFKEAGRQEEPLLFRPRWRVADLAVAAAVFFAFVLGTIPALQRSNFEAANLACSSNLLQLWRGLEQYSTGYNAYPNAVALDDRLPVGAMMSQMRQTGHLDETTPLTCPCCRKEVLSGDLPTWQEIRRAEAEMDKRLTELLEEAYAFHPGLRASRGLRHLERSAVDPLRSVVPMVADRPPVNTNFQVQAGNSPSHGGHGQNVIFADGHATFIHSRSLGQVDSDLYRNRQGKPEAGNDVMDIILVPANAHFPIP